MDGQVDQGSSMNMDSSTMNMDHGGMGTSMASMSFHLGCNEIILFNFWAVDSPGGKKNFKEIRIYSTKYFKK